MGYLYALAAVFFWSFNIIIASYFAQTLTPWEIAFGRWFVAALILVPMAWGSLKANFLLLLKNWPLVCWLAVTGVVIQNTMIYYAGRTASAVDMGLLDVTGPVFLVILSRIFLKTQISFRQILGLAIAVFGVIVIILQGDFSQLAKIKLVSGDFWMLVNTFTFAVYSLLQSKRPTQVSQSAMLASSTVIGVMMVFPIMLLTTPEHNLLHLSGEALGVMIYLGIFNSVLSYLAWNTSLAQIGNVKAGIIYYLLPIFSGIEAYFILGEKIYASEIAGGILVISGIMLTSLPRKKQPQVKSAPTSRN